MSKLTIEEHNHIAKVLAFVGLFYSREFFTSQETTSKTQAKKENKRGIKIIDLVNKLNNLLDDEFFVHFPHLQVSETPYYGKYNNDEWHHKSLSEWRIG